MHKAIAEISQFPLPGAPDAARARLRWLPRPRWSPRSPRLGIGWRLGLGLAAVTAVLLLGESLATRTARQALEAVRSMQTEHEPLANRANAVLEKLIDDVYRRIVSAGGSGLAINGTQVVAERSLAELHTAINAVRGNQAPSAVIAQREREFREVLNAHSAEFEASPGRAWLSLVRQDFAEAARLRRASERYDGESGPLWHSLREDSAALTVGVQRELQLPAREGLLLAAQHAATAAEGAEHTLRNTSFAVLALMLLVSALLAVSISVPVRRLTAATRLLAGGDRGARAPRGGSAEIDELAESFNTMADRIAHAETELRAHQTELEQRVAERTRQLHHLAHHDPLTQLPNRRSLAAQLESALSRAASGQRLALLFVDVDNFKSINDTLGHSFGDRVLQHIAERLHAATGPAGRLARLGGDEVTVLLEDVKSSEQGAARAADIVATRREPGPSGG